MSDISARGTLTVADGGVTTAISPAVAFTYDLLAPETHAADGQTLSTAFSDISLGSVGWTNATFLMLINKSVTAGEDMTVKVLPKLVAGLTAATPVAGASLAATQSAAGYYCIITADGTSQSKDWKKGDYAIYLGSSGAYAQIRPKGIKLLPGETAGPFRVEADGTAWQVCSATGTPRMEFVAAGLLDE